MMNFEQSLQAREIEGWKSNAKKKTGYTEYEVAEFLHGEKTIEPPQLQQQPVTSQ